MSDNLDASTCSSQHFPIRQSAEHDVSRRAFAKSLGLLSLGTVAGSALGSSHRWFSSAGQESIAAVAVALVDEIKVGGYKLIRYPNAEDPCIVVRLEQDKFAAFSQRCTHLMCPVHFRADRKELVCPCHKGYFSAENGRVLAGPPKRPLTQYPVEIRENQIWVKPAPDHLV